MKNLLVHAALGIMLSLVLYAGSASAQTENPPAQTVQNTQTQDHDGDGIPNGQDADFVRGSGAGRGAKVNFVDANGDGICDYFQNGRRGGRGRGNFSAISKTAQGVQFVDADGDGVCDNNASGTGARNGRGRGPNFIDANGDGICDNFQGAGAAGSGGMRKGRGRMGNR